jgi:hypothetical protein
MKSVDLAEGADHLLHVGVVGVGADEHPALQHGQTSWRDGAWAEEIGTFVGEPVHHAST